ncbi:GNAT family N-acetyltransferase [Kitasatospora viridis]|uniref:CelD/BcsL family acetyltransferase involved in cellulose biosynthesis n=1 Tax=Kitasatospora viridis TaxID=281105 RepID=A0A561UD19_9ACTN|nr:GNAT family N-acetyltransferase [Kitasatospora viridis]TWF97274.1 CelD/BcsL family acetyltransferase involved in cellulose biosynthesis [Kitasatospora viridis]
MTDTRRAAAVPAPARPGDPAGPAEAVRWQTEVRRDDGALDELAAEWDDLAERCATATPFQAAAWQASWWRQYGRPGRLRVVLVRRGGRLVAATALHRTRGGVLTALGGGLIDCTDLLLDDRYTDEAAARLAAALPLRRPWQALELREVPPGSAAHQVYAHWSGRRHQLLDSLCQHLPAVSMERMYDRMPGRTAQKRRAKQRKLEAVGVRAERVEPAAVPAAMGELLRLHALQWETRGVTPEHTTERFRAHLAESTAGLAERGQAVVYRYHLDGELVAVDLLLLGRTFAGLYLYGAHPGLRERLDVAGLLFATGLAEAVAAGVPVISLMRGDEPYKSRWRPDREHNHRLLLGPRRGAVLLSLRLAAVRGRAALAPRLREPVRRLRALLRR